MSKRIVAPFSLLSPNFTIHSQEIAAKMGDPMSNLEKMGTELRCPICLSLLNSAVSLTCNHVFCNSCIMKSMKSGSNCPVCKVPYRRREVRAAPHMDSLVNIYKSMEAASGFPIFVTQNPPSTKLSEEKKQDEGDASCFREDIHMICQDKKENQITSKSKGTRRNVKSNLEVYDHIAAKPSFPTKKRVQVPQCIPSEPPTQPQRLETESSENIKDQCKNSSLVERGNPIADERGKLLLSPFFWLRDEEDIEKLSQNTIGSQLLDITPPNIPTFSDIKDSDDEIPSKLSPEDKMRGKSNGSDLFDSEMFEWTQRPCSPELLSSPAEMQDENAGKENKQEAPLLSSNTNEHSIESEKCSNTEREMAATDEKPPKLSPMRPKSTDSQIVHDNKRCRAAKVATLAKCAEKDAKQDFKVSLNSKGKSRGVMQKEGDYKKGSSLTSKKTRSEKDVSGPSAIQSISENVRPVSLREEALDLSNKKTAAELGKKQCHGEDHRKIDTGRMSGKVSTQRQSDCSLRSRKRKLNSIDADKNGEICAVKSLEDEGTNSPEVDGKHVSNIKKKHQKHGNAETAVSSDNNQKLRCKKNMKISFCGISEDELIIDPEKDQNHISSKNSQFTKTFNNVSAKDTQSIEMIQASLVSQKLGKLGHANEVALRTCGTSTPKVKCAFCLSSEDSEASGDMVHFYNGRPVASDYNSGSKIIHCHRNCAEWAPDVYFEYDTAINLEAELSRSRRIKCCCCGLKGAALGCYEKSCRKSFHVTCAKMIPQCRWDADNFVILCPLHASSKLPNEDSGSQERTKKKCIPKRQKPNLCNQVGFQDDVSKYPTWNSSKTSEKLVLCCSGLSVEEREIISQFERLSGVTVLKNWDLSVTHVIASTDENGACRRTLKILMGILEGKWILDIEWVKACMKAMKPVEEEQYEIMVDIHGIKDGPPLGRLRILNKQPKLFEGYKFYLMGEFIASYKGYIQDLLVAGGGSILHRKPISGVQGAMSFGSSAPSTFIIYSLELPDKCDHSKKDMILNRRRSDAEALASVTGAKAVNNSWVLSSIAACKLQNFAE